MFLFTEIKNRAEMSIQVKFPGH